MLKYFFAELDPNVCFVPLAEVGVKKPVFIVDFISAMEAALAKIDPNGLSKNKVANMEKVKQWIEEYRQPGAAENSPKTVPSTQKINADSTNNSVDGVVSAVSASAEPVVPSVVPASKVHSSVTEKKPPVPAEFASIAPVTVEDTPADTAAYLIDLLTKASKVVSVVKSEDVQQKIKIDALSVALETVQNKLHGANQQIADLQDTITELRKKLSAAEGDIFVLRQTVEQRDAVIAEKDAEIAERVKMAEVLSRDRSKQADESLQRLASKIRVEYRDFVDALDVPMSCDLGENLRLQLQSIFDILEKGGMKFK